MLTGLQGGGEPDCDGPSWTLEQVGQAGVSEAERCLIGLKPQVPSTPGPNEEGAGRGERSGLTCQGGNVRWGRGVDGLTWSRDLEGPLGSPVLIVACLSMYIRVLWVEPGATTGPGCRVLSPWRTISEASST